MQDFMRIQPAKAMPEIVQSSAAFEAELTVNDILADQLSIGKIRIQSFDAKVSAPTQSASPYKNLRQEHMFAYRPLVAKTPKIKSRHQWLISERILGILVMASLWGERRHQYSACATLDQRSHALNLEEPKQLVCLDDHQISVRSFIVDVDLLWLVPGNDPDVGQALCTLAKQINGELEDLLLGFHPSIMSVMSAAMRPRRLLKILLARSGIVRAVNQA